jgi:hypothetical protein
MANPTGKNLPTTCPDSPRPALFHPFLHLFDRSGMTGTARVGRLQADPNRWSLQSSIQIPVITPLLASAIVS